MKRSVGLVFAIASVALMSCAYEDPTAVNFKGGTLGNLEFWLTGGTEAVFDRVVWTVVLVDAPPPEDLVVLEVDIVDDGHKDYGVRGVLVMDSTHPSFARATQWLTDGVNGQVLLMQATLGRVTTILITSERSLIDFASRDKPDFAGWEITALRWTLVFASLTSPGTDPRGDEVWTDYEIRGDIVVEGRPLNESASL